MAKDGHPSLRVWRDFTEFDRAIDVKKRGMRPESATRVELMRCMIRCAFFDERGTGRKTNRGFARRGPEGGIDERARLMHAV